MTYTILHLSLGLLCLAWGKNWEGCWRQGAAEKPKLQSGEISHECMPNVLHKLDGCDRAN